MPKATGAGGNFSSITGFNASWETWSLDFDFGEVDTTAFADLGYTNAEATICKATFEATGTGMFNATTTSPISATALASTFLATACAGSFTFTVMTGCTYAFTGVITGQRQTRSAKQGTKHEISMRGTNQGAITQTWDQTA